MILHTPKDFSLRIRERRRELRWTQAALADAASVSRWFVLEVEKGKETAEFGRVLRVLNALGLLLDVKVSPHGLDDPWGSAGSESLRQRRLERFRRQEGGVGEAEE